MLYERKMSDGVLVSEDQMVGYREHLSREHRVLFLSGVVGLRCPNCGGGETESHNLLLALDSLSHEPIKLIITSPGGDLDATFLFYDTMKLIKSPIEILGRYCASGAALLLSAGNKRYLMPHAKVMLHLPAAQFPYSDTKDMAIHYKEMNLYQERILDILINAGVKRSREQILVDIDRELWMGPEEAVAYGLADKVMEQEDLERWLT